MRTYIHIYIRTYVHTHIHKHTHTHTHTYTHIHIHINIHTSYIHTYVLVDRDMGGKYWYHPAEMITLLTENNETSTIQIFTDGRKLEQGVRGHSHIQDT
jgi:hypothetical protein